VPYTSGHAEGAAYHAKIPRAAPTSEDTRRGGELRQILRGAPPPPPRGVNRVPPSGIIGGVSGRCGNAPAAAARASAAAAAEAAAAAA